MTKLHLNASSDIERLTRLLLRRLIGQYNAVLPNRPSGPQCYVLEVLRDNGPSSCSDIAEELGVTLPAVTNLANKLTAAGLAERLPHQTDRRTVMLRITEDGLAALRELDASAAAIIGCFWSALQPEELEELCKLLGKALLAEEQENAGR